MPTDRPKTQLQRSQPGRFIRYLLVNGHGAVEENGLEIQLAGGSNSWRTRPPLEAASRGFDPTTKGRPPAVGNTGGSGLASVTFGFEPV